MKLDYPSTLGNGGGNGSRGLLRVAEEGHVGDVLGSVVLSARKLDIFNKENTTRFIIMSCG